MRKLLVPVKFGGQQGCHVQVGNDIKLDTVLGTALQVTPQGSSAIGRGSSNPTNSSLVVWPGTLFPNSRGNKAAVNLCLKLHQVISTSWDVTIDTLTYLLWALLSNSRQVQGFLAHSDCYADTSPIQLYFAFLFVLCSIVAESRIKVMWSHCPIWVLWLPKEFNSPSWPVLMQIIVASFKEAKSCQYKMCWILDNP